MARRNLNLQPDPEIQVIPEQPAAPQPAESRTSIEHSELLSRATSLEHAGFNLDDAIKKRAEEQATLDAQRAVDSLLSQVERFKAPPKPSIEVMAKLAEGLRQKRLDEEADKDRMRNKLLHLECPDCGAKNNFRIYRETVDFVRRECKACGGRFETSPGHAKRPLAQTLGSGEVSWLSLGSCPHCGASKLHHSLCREPRSENYDCGHCGNSFWFKGKDGKWLT